MSNQPKWLFEIKVVRAIRADYLGAKYDASALITNVDGEVHIEDLLAKDGVLTNDDLVDVGQKIKEAFGVDRFFYSRIKNGKRIKKMRVIKL